MPEPITAPAAPDHPLARRMAIVAFLAQGCSFAAMFGTFGVLLTAVEARTGASREASSLGIVCVSVATALLAPFVGGLAERLSIRLLMAIGALMGAAGYAILAAAGGSTPVYLLVYALLLGPGLCLSGAVLPSTLVTRWFTAGRGRALGFVHMPVLLVGAPLAAAAVLSRYGIAAVYATLAVTMLATLVPIAFVVDRPPGAATVARGIAPAAGLTTAQLIARPLFWVLVLAAGATFAGAAMLGAHLVPMVGGWGIAPGRAAALFSLMSIAGMAGALLFGWIGDRLGGGWALAIACFDGVLLWLLLATEPTSYAAVAVLVALIAGHGAAALPSFGKAVSDAFGAASFARAFGLGNLAFLPFTASAVPIAATTFVRTGSYVGALVGEAALLALTLAVTVIALRRRRPPPPPPLAA